MEKQMKVLVLGAGGFAGAVLVRQLLTFGYKVRAVDNFHRGNCDSLIPYCMNPDFEFTFGDITNRKDVMKAIQGVDAIILLSAIVGEPASRKNPSLSYLVNVIGTKNVVDLKPNDVPLFFASTGSVYGKLDELCTEESPTNPQSAYGIHKKQAEDVVLNANNTYAYRFATAFGPSPSLRVNLLVNDLCLQAYKNKSLVIFQADFLRTFIHIEDFCDSFIWGIQRRDTFKHRLFNVGHPEGNFTKREIAEKIKSKTNCKVFYEDIMEDPDQRNYAVSYQKFLDTGWTPNFSVEEGIDQMLKIAPLLNMRNPYE